MLPFERAAQLQVKGSIPAKLKQPAFAVKDPLWQKETSNPNFQPSQVTTKRHEFIKIGKTFGFEITRYLTFFKGHLLYYDSDSDVEFKGYCNLQNVYVQWVGLANGKYLLYLSNGAEVREFFFNGNGFWKEFEGAIGQVGVQLNFKDKYEVIEQIGKGSFSKVYHVTHSQSKMDYAAKIISKKDKNKSCTKGLVLEQRKILRLINSEYVYKFKEMFEEEEYYIVMLDYLPGKDLMVLWKEKKVTDLAMILKLLVQVLQGVRDIHKAGVIHRDLKPQNIHINLKTFKPYIIDFGLSLCLDNTVTTKSFKRCGTMGYMAPEVIENAGENKKPYGAKCDLFSLGIICHMLLMGYNPLKGENYDQTFLKNKTCEIDLNKKLLNTQNGDHCFMFMTKMLAKYPQYRFDAEQALASPFLTQKTQSKDPKDPKDKEESSSTVQEKNKSKKQIILPTE